MAGVTTSSTSKPFLNLEAAARNMVTAAVAVTTGQLGLSSPADTMKLLQQGDARAVTLFRRELAQQISGAILMLDKHVDAVFEEGPHRGHSLPGNDLHRPFRLWVVSRLHTATLYERLDALNQALVQAFSMFGEPDTTPLVETFVIDAHDGHPLCAGQRQGNGVPLLLASRQ